MISLTYGHQTTVHSYIKGERVLYSSLTCSTAPSRNTTNSNSQTPTKPSSRKTRSQPCQVCNSRMIKHILQHLTLLIGASLWLVPPQPHHLLQHNDKSHGLHIPHPHLPGHAKRHPQDLSTSANKSHSRKGSKDLSSSHHHKIHETLTELITTIPSQTTISSTSEPLNFVPHITLTSGIDLSALQPSPKVWLERLAIPQQNDVTVSFTSLEVGPTFTKKLFLRCDKGGLQGLAELARWQGVEASNGIGGASGMGAEDGRRRAEQWAEDKFDPHVSLL